MTLGDLLRQDGALVLLGIGAVIGFFAGKFFRTSARRKEEHIPGEAKVLIAPGVAGPVPVYSQAKTTAGIAAITAAVNKYRTENI
jgi:hypothetical protein